MRGAFMKKHILIVVAIIFGCVFMTGCTSKGRLDYAGSTPVSSFGSHDEIKSSFESLEADIDNGKTITRAEVHARGFDPLKTQIEQVDYVNIIDKFTASGNLVSARLGVEPPPVVLTCVKVGKVCTAYRVSVKNIQNVEIPQGSNGTLKAVFDLEETRFITIWEYSVIIVFHKDVAVYAQVEKDVAPNTTKTQEKNSLLKKVGRAVTP